MTYDELIGNINEDCYSHERLGNAILAVVHFHQTFQFTLGEETFTSCNGCGQYPCPTIQAIEKELQ